MYFVYILQSEMDGRYYHGFTRQEPWERLKRHNYGAASYTKKYRPWKMVWYGAFTTKEKAEQFERYLKTGSGHAFSRKRLLA